MTNPEIRYREAEPKDVPAILELVRELAAFEKAPHLVENTEDQLLADGFSETPAFKSFVAAANNQVIAFALSYIRYSTWRGKVVYLEDIYVKPEFRSLGIGRKLMEIMLDYTRSLGIKYLVLQVLDWNNNAIRFYESFNCQMDPEWINVLIEVNQDQPSTKV